MSPFLLVPFLPVFCGGAWTEVAKPAWSSRKVEFERSGFREVSGKRTGVESRDRDPWYPKSNPSQESRKGGGCNGREIRGMHAVQVGRAAQVMCEESRRWQVG
ncbi:hypothetical protein QBC37DRAFT_98412 [Rhypophila decipiens]|uniref:Secreted protein n=1 Tax=Rhypophila decipiens TaxID=261697 RepID=A0AAN6YD34_9PEZI|nr:hypothetical protein QBC37DRAFT_98412 [Rhypophila decipiens]